MAVLRCSAGNRDRRRRCGSARWSSWRRPFALAGRGGGAWQRRVAAPSSDDGGGAHSRRRGEARVAVELGHTGQGYTLNRAEGVGCMAWRARKGNAGGGGGLPCPPLTPLAEGLQRARLGRSDCGSEDRVRLGCDAAEQQQPSKGLKEHHHTLANGPS
jgi:hypothetical protein